MTTQEAQDDLAAAVAIIIGDCVKELHHVSFNQLFANVNSYMVREQLDVIVSVLVSSKLVTYVDGQLTWIGK